MLKLVMRTPAMIGCCSALRRLARMSPPVRRGVRRCGGQASSAGRDALSRHAAAQFGPGSRPVAAEPPAGVGAGIRSPSAGALPGRRA